MYRQRNPLRAATGGIFLIGLAIAFALGGRFDWDWFLPILFITLALTSLLGASSFNRRGIYGGFYGFVWMMALALFFITGSWLWFLVGAGASILLGAFARPMMGAAFMANQRPPQQPYQPYQEQPPTYQSYQQGYQPPAQQPPQQSYQEGGQQHSYPQPQYEQPTAQYPQELPPQQQ